MSPRPRCDFLQSDKMDPLYNEPAGQTTGFLAVVGFLVAAGGVMGLKYVKSPANIKRCRTTLLGGLAFGIVFALISGVSTAIAHLKMLFVNPLQYAVGTDRYGQAYH